MKFASVVVHAVAFTLLGALVACSDSDPMRSEESTFLIKGWRASSSTSAAPSFPVAVEVGVLVDESSSSGVSPAPDGTPVSFRTSAGRFDGGLASVEARTTAGGAFATLTLDAPGSTTVTARVGQVRSTVVLTVGSSGAVQIGS